MSTTKKPREEEKRLALALIATYDENGISEGIEGVLEKNFSHIPDYQLHTERTSDLKSLSNYLREYSSERKIDTLIIAYHGSPEWIGINDEEEIGQEEIEEFFRKHRDVFAEDATILLHSCYTGGEADSGKNIAESISYGANVDVMAPKYELSSEYSVDDEEENKIFTQDEKGKVIFNDENFFKIRFNIERELSQRNFEGTEIVPKAYEWWYIDEMRKFDPNMKVEEASDAFLYVKRPR